MAKQKQPKLKRTYQEAFLLNDKEKEAIEVYCKKCKINNKSKFFRECIMRTVMDYFIKNYPTLFEKHELDNLVVSHNNGA